jgi:hypothetical protein
MNTEGRDSINAILNALVIKALENGLDLIRTEGCPLIPFVLTQKDDRTTLYRFTTQSLEESAQQARHFISTLDVDCYAMVIDSCITLNNQWHDAILIEAAESQQPFARLFAQCYELEPTFKTIGTPVYLGNIQKKIPA